ncbi:hypothetical protein ACFWNH_30275 [Rhodococcus qingshengii]|uniref:hypothetical protein n=1 Tax=Rhodococcus qingshengii TaxID=334542 RepID=UPI0036519FA1
MEITTNLSDDAVVDPEAGEHSRLAQTGGVLCLDQVSPKTGKAGERLNADRPYL